MAYVREIIQAMEKIAPPTLAFAGDRDRIGLHAGDPEAKISTVALALDASLPAISAAKKLGAEMLIVHHPRFHSPIRNLVEDDPSGKRGLAIIRSGLAVYSAHTNLDAAPNGTNDQLANAAGLVSREVIEASYRERLYKLAVFVPAGHAEKMVKALDKAGAGAIGRYSGCTFRGRGVGTFRCGADTSPFQGKPGSWEEADEFRIETIFGELSREVVVSAMLGAHPYEEPAYDMYPVMGEGRVFGLGYVGELPAVETVKGLASRLALSTGSGETRFSGKGGRRVRRVGVWAGAGASSKRMSECGVEALVTGEVGYHDVEMFMDKGISVIALGHGWSEELVLKPLMLQLMSMVKGLKVGIAGRGFISMRNI